MNKFEKTNQKTLNDISQGIRTSPLKVIRLKCLDCMAGNEAEVRHCPSEDCILWKYRFGKNESGKRSSGKKKVFLKVSNINSEIKAL